MRPVTPDTISGKSWQGLVLHADGQYLHPAIVTDWQRLVDDARQDGIDLGLASGFRSFSRQRDIWSAKYCGDRPVFDDDGCELAVEAMDEISVIKAIMRFSAVPGVSRHHWGTDIDVYDKAAMPDGYRLQLSPSEYAADGIFSRLSHWLDERIACGRSYGFFRPYSPDRERCCGIADEPWHLSYAPVSNIFQQALTVSLWRDMLARQHFPGSELIKKQAESLYSDYLDIGPETWPSSIRGA